MIVGNATCCGPEDPPDVLSASLHLRVGILSNHERLARIAFGAAPHGPDIEKENIAFAQPRSGSEGCARPSELREKSSCPSFQVLQYS